MTSDSTKMDPTRLTPEQAARLLSAACRVQITQDEIAADLTAGAPRNADGTINLASQSLHSAFYNNRLRIARAVAWRLSGPVVARCLAANSAARCR